MSFGELAILAWVTKSMKPRTVFEIGTYNGMTTAIFLLNSVPEARIVTLDLPVDSAEGHVSIPSDRMLVASRHLASVPQALGLRRYTQLLCDSMAFDPSAYLNSVDLGLIDAAHDLVHVENDTVKMARMMVESGMVFWHDYGGKGQFRPLAQYVEALGKRASVYRIPGTSLAWAEGHELKKALGGATQS
jgi:Methyltransferase domain